MPIRVNCQQCGKQFSAWEDLVGQSVQCPKCQSPMTVPGGGGASSVESSGWSDEKRRGAFQPPPESPPKSRSIDQFDDSESLPIACPNCNHRLPEDEELCDACGYHRILKKVLDTADIHQPDQATGFERVFKQQLAEGENPEKTLLLIKVVAGLGILSLLASIFLCTGNLLLLLVFVVALAGVAVYLTTQALRSGRSGVNDDPLSVAIWSTMLAVQRVMGWRALHWPFPSTRALILHDPGLTDDHLAELENLRDVQTLDLEGTQITDRGLVHLEKFKQLRFLVLRKTRVTDEGVQRLQQKLNETLIWH